MCFFLPPLSKYRIYSGFRLSVGDAVIIITEKVFDIFLTCTSVQRVVCYTAHRTHSRQRRRLIRHRCRDLLDSFSLAIDAMHVSSVSSSNCTPAVAFCKTAFQAPFLWLSLIDRKALYMTSSSGLRCNTYQISIDHV